MTGSERMNKYTKVILGFNVFLFDLLILIGLFRLTISLIKCYFIYNKLKLYGLDNDEIRSAFYTYFIQEGWIK